jgi:hypothetical protein
VSLSVVSMRRILHFQNRLRVRHGFILSSTEIDKFCDSIREKGPSIKLNSRLWVFRIKLRDKAMAILWDRKHDVPVTVYPDSALIQYKTKTYSWNEGRFLTIQRRGK